jgi:hypothetical protein
MHFAGKIKNQKTPLDKSTNRYKKSDQLIKRKYKRKIFLLVYRSSRKIKKQNLDQNAKKNGNKSTSVFTTVIYKKQKIFFFLNRN